MTEKRYNDEEVGEIIDKDGYKELLDEIYSRVSKHTFSDSEERAKTIKKIIDEKIEAAE